jgi:hypothetical protein
MINFEEFYSQFHLPLTDFDCGEKCAPYNEFRIPFCCDIRHAVPTAFDLEWVYLDTKSTLWHLWEGENQDETGFLRNQTPSNQVLVECQGHTKCQRNFRTLTCRAFPFFPYINIDAEFIGLSYYWQYEDRCWVISHLDRVSKDYRSQFVAAYEQLFCMYPKEIDNFRHHSIVMRRIFGRRKRTIPILHRNGRDYKISPSNGRLSRVNSQDFPKFGPYLVAKMLPFPEER